MTSIPYNILSESSKKANQSQFIETLYSMIESQQYPYLINWADSQGTFTIYRPNVFAQEILPVLCKHSNLSSFVRQLNMYCFKKCRAKPLSDSVSYWHPFFVQGQPELLKNVIRKNPRHILAEKKARLQELGLESKPSVPKVSKERSSPVEAASSPVQVTIEPTKTRKVQNEVSGYSKIDFLYQYIENFKSKDDEGAMTLIRDYLRDDEDDDQDSFEDPSTFKKIKHESGNSNTRFVRMDMKTMNCTLFESKQSKESLNSVSERKSQVFDNSDYNKCQNLIKNLFAIPTKIKNSPSSSSSCHESEFTRCQSQELTSCNTGEPLEYETN